MAGSTSVQLYLAAANSSPISSFSRSGTEALRKKLPLNFFTLVSAMVA